MAQVVPPEILNVMAMRPQLKATETRAVLPGNVVEMIRTIRTDIPSGEDGDGWNSVCRNWRSGPSRGGGAAAASGGHYSPRQQYGVIGRGSGGHGGAGGAAPISSKTWDTRKTIAPAAAAAPVTADAVAAAAGAAAAAAGAAAAAPPAMKPRAPVIAPIGKYVSRFKSAAAEPVESTIVNTIILNKLNKFSPANYDECKEFLMEILGSGETDFLSDFMRLVFRKAAAEETFCPLYAQLLSDLSAGYPFLLDEMATLYTKFLDIFQEVDEGACADMEEFIQKNKEKKYRKGYAQFLAELLKFNIADQVAFSNTLRQIIGQIDTLSRVEDKSNTLEEYSDCLLCILNALKGRNTAAAKAIRESALEQLMPLTVRSAERPSLTNRIRFTILNATDSLKAV
jgi:hypothetical protein